mmetsp:Transcript_38613/g.89708  ORF Transcript_38613/g.89708 Transcript_38613/m.89708 type:complete len:133 (-) Transcript_38613:839-1237(-)
MSDGFELGIIERDGWIEGVSDGFELGTEEGLLDGFELGIAEGNIEGWVERVSDGFKLGFKEGVSDGFELGVIEKDTVGAEVGNDVIGAKETEGPREGDLVLSGSVTNFPGSSTSTNCIIVLSPLVSLKVTLY